MGLGERIYIGRGRGLGLVILFTRISFSPIEVGTRVRGVVVGNELRLGL